MSIFVIIGLLALWALVGPALALRAAGRAESRALALEARLAALERTTREPEPAAEIAAATPSEPRSAEAYPTSVPIFVPHQQPALEQTMDAESAAAPAAAAESPAETLETRLGARWSVLVGGVALALGAIFLVRYSIEQGLVGPRLRIALGYLLSAVLLAAGEVLRRRDRELRLPVLTAADVPAILTAAGGVGLFAATYAAYALYGFFPPALAFILLTAAGLVTLALSVIHGPMLAALGALASYASPLLVSSDAPQPLPVAIHILVVTGAVLAMARLRRWTWLALAGIAASLAWGVLLSAIDTGDAQVAEVALIGGLGFVYVLCLAPRAETGAPRDRGADRLAIAAMAGIAGLHIFYAAVELTYPTFLWGLVLTGFLGAAASSAARMSPSVLVGAVVAAATMALLPHSPGAETGMYRLGALSWRVAEGGAGLLAAPALGLAAVIGLGSFLSARRAAATAPRTAGYFAGAGAAAPLVILLVVYARTTPLETRPGFGFAALALATIFAAMTEHLIRRRPADDAAPAPGLYAAGAVLAACFAGAVALTTHFLPLAFSLGSAGIVLVFLARPVRLLPWLAVIAAAFAVTAAILLPYGIDEIGTRPLLNGLLLRLGLPAAALVFAAEVLRRRRDGLPSQLLQTLALAMTAAFVALEIHHFANGGVLRQAIGGLGEQGALTLAALAFALGLQRIAGRTRSRVYAAASLAAGIVGVAMIAAGQFVIYNPVLTGEPVGGNPVFNLLLSGYLLPAVLAGIVAHASRPVRPAWFVRLYAALTLGLAFTYVSLVVRQAFWGSVLDRPDVLDAENWAYSAVWLAFGLAILAGGVVLRSGMVRAASGLVIALVICKVFLLDMSALTGALRAASFIGLGGVLILIGRVYQRFVLVPAAPAPPAAPA